MADVIEKLSTKAIIQHGKLNDRIYLMDLGNCYVKKTIKLLNQIGKENDYGKIFAKIPAWAKNRFEADGYISEAKIPKFYNKETTVYFMAKFLSKKRQKDHNAVKTKEIIDLAKSKKGSDKPELPTKSFKIKPLSEKDAEPVADLYKMVFKSYPFPIDSPKYIKKTMKKNVFYFGIEKGKKLISVASSETNRLYGYVEMTDFATDPDFRGKNLSFSLLQLMEKEMMSRKLLTWFTIARSMSPGMNITFAKSGYKFGGTLVNNTNICGEIENMNVWYKSAKSIKKKPRLWTA